MLKNKNLVTYLGILTIYQMPIDVKNVLQVFQINNAVKTVVDREKNTK